ncbi:hypothetical protein [Candidatus Vampirococcus lugosii]|uniref:Uncharacterized protein n=1 Tax=Candidatus Vampirococcus lugosii TaxID=2789015 RepID=A0ABS5QKP5_9BACT|nr:hypothetical protein [Candidatus Vampirococcus lugosii]MBS8121743.1 hypothetical protein [Candidatus Vampirococcus lugosii]
MNRGELVESLQDNSKNCIIALNNELGFDFDKVKNQIIELNDTISNYTLYDLDDSSFFLVDVKVKEILNTIPYNKKQIFFEHFYENQGFDSVEKGFSYMQNIFDNLEQIYNIQIDKYNSYLNSVKDNAFLGSKVCKLRGPILTNSLSNIENNLKDAKLTLSRLLCNDTNLYLHYFLFSPQANIFKRFSKIFSETNTNFSRGFNSTMSVFEKYRSKISLGLEMAEVSDFNLDENIDFTSNRIKEKLNSLEFFVQLFRMLLIFRLGSSNHINKYNKKVLDKYFDMYISGNICCDENTDLLVYNFFWNIILSYMRKGFLKGNI